MDNEQLLQQLVDKLLAHNNRSLDQEARDLKWRKQKFFLVLFLLIAGALLYIQALATVFGSKDGLDEDYAAVVTINGPIMPSTDNSAYNIIAGLDSAFTDEDAKGIVLYVNSPGGTPVQAALIADHIKRLREEYPEKEIVTVAEDYLASGAYMAAMGTDEIYVHRSTIAGSIGVVTEGFGYHGILNKIDLERRVHTAGENKRRLDPYFPEENEDVVDLNKRLGKVHQQFIALVKERRGEKLIGTHEQLFNGDVWTGDDAVALGLVDGLNDLDGVIREKFNVKHIKDFTPKPDLFARLTNSVKRQVSTMLAEHLTTQGRVMTIY